MAWADRMPLEDFPLAKQEEIARLVAAPKPPPKWLSLNGGLAQIQSRAWHEWYRQRGINPESRRGKIPLRIRLAVFERDGSLCRLCGGVVESDDIHLDHITPVSLGGPTTVDNLQVTHSRCNMRKGNRVAA